MATKQVIKQEEHIKDYMRKWQDIEEEIITNTNIPINKLLSVLDLLDLAYKENTTDKEIEEVINKVHNKLFRGKKWFRRY